MRGEDYTYGQTVYRREGRTYRYGHYGQNLFMSLALFRELLGLKLFPVA